MSSECLIAFGSNVGNRQLAFEAVIQSLRESNAISDCQTSRCIETTPIGGPAKQKKFLNAVIRITTEFGPFEVWNALSELESKLGRTRNFRWEPRIVDLDILLYGQQIIQTRELIVPHPRMSFRRFVLEPACEIAADMIHPVSGQSIAELLDHINVKPNIVLLVGFDEPTSGSIGETLRSVGRVTSDNKIHTPEFAHWDFRSVNDLLGYQAAAAETKLAVIYRPAVSNGGNSNSAIQLLEHAAGFPGPTLIIDNVCLATQEISAAIDAMVKSPTR